MRRLPLLVAAGLGLWCGTAAAAVKLTAMPRVSLLDERVHIRVTGLAPHTSIAVEGREGKWLSRGLFRADGHGAVDLTRDASAGGTYKGRDGMGLFWSMDPIGAMPDWQSLASPTRLRVLVHGKVAAETSIERRALSPEVSVTDETLATDGFVGRYYTPREATRSLTPVLVLGGSEGGLEGSVVPGLLAHHGFAALNVAYFDEPGLPSALVDIPLEYFVRAIQWLDAQPNVDPSKLVVTGASYGSQAALFLGADFPQLVHGVIGLMPADQAKNGLAPGGASSTTQVPAWMLGGVGIAPGTLIPVERITAPLMLVGGQYDIPGQSVFTVPAIVMRHGPQGVTALVYPGAGHFVDFAVPYTPTPTVQTFWFGSIDGGGSRVADERARVDLWPRLLRFLRSI